MRAVIGGLVGLALCQPIVASATTYSMISDSNMAYCDLFAKRSGGTAAEMYKAYGDCIRVLPTRLPMPEAPGTVPATDRPPEPGDEAWRAQCRAEYRTWDEETGTVIRRGSPERVKCPCGAEVDCGG